MTHIENAAIAKQLKDFMSAIHWLDPLSPWPKGALVFSQWRVWLSNEATPPKDVHSRPDTFKMLGIPSLADAAQVLGMLTNQPEPVEALRKFADESAPMFVGVFAEFRQV